MSTFTTHLGTVLGLLSIGRDISTDKWLSTEALLLSVAIGSEVTALLRPDTSSGAKNSWPIVGKDLLSSASHFHSTLTTPGWHHNLKFDLTATLIIDLVEL